MSGEGDEVHAVSHEERPEACSEERSGHAWHAVVHAAGLDHAGT
jgi:hypothetical protein